MKRWTWLLTVLIVSALSGCGASVSETDLVGRWLVRPTSIAAQPKISEGKSPQEAEAIGRALGSITVEFNADKTFLLNMGADFGGTIAGKWAFDAESSLVLCTVNSINGQAVAAPGAAPTSPPVSSAPLAPGQAAPSAPAPQAAPAASTKFTFELDKTDPTRLTMNNVDPSGIYLVFEKRQ